MPENRNEVDTFKIVYFIENSGWDVGSDEIGTDFFTGNYDEAVEYAKNQIKEEWKDKVELISGYVDFDTYGCTTAYFDLETGKEITEEETEARDYEVGIRTEGFDIYWDYPEKEEEKTESSIEKTGATRFKEGDEVKYEPTFFDRFTSDLEPGIIGTVIDGGMGWGIHPDPARKYIMVAWETGEGQGVLPESLVKISSQKKKALDIESLDVESLDIKSLNREELENLLKDWIGEENLREPLKEWSTEDIIYELEGYQKLLIESKTIKDMGSLIDDEAVIRPSFSSDFSIEKEIRR